MSAPSWIGCSLGALGLSIASGCSCSCPPGPTQVETHLSAQQTLILANRGSETITLESLAEGGSDIEIAPGDQEALDFVVATVSNVEQHSEQPWLVVTPETSINDPTFEPAGYVDQDGLSYVFRTSQVDSEPRLWQLSLQACLPGWDEGPAPPAQHEIDLAAPPTTVSPQPLCPRP